ncbi:putative hydrolase [Hydrogenispora ethanolica]|uniref:Putative hydrolase n=1 Tax=Hydrogenispora ethanolica TaxID=1082276 RepID=A0A4R1RKE5_HYDET|nr:phosphatase [Hydrogenispora ethanolica]TCL66526.1 putative hydrolase [Hydrogenispora ethanolica]
MQLVVDTHTHTLVSGHAYSTVQENARAAKAKGLAMMAMTDHGPAMPGAPTWVYFENLKVIPPLLEGVRIIKGAEVNITDYQGRLDIPDTTLRKLDFAIASLHDLCLIPAGIEENTAAMIHVLRNPYIDGLAHPGNPQFPVAIDRVVAAAKQYHKLIELNNHSFTARAGSAPNCREFAVQCKAAGVRVICGSDAHFSTGVGEFDHVRRLLETVAMPEELMLNASAPRFEAYLQERKERIAKGDPGR